ncbi:MAG: polyprenyl synthetase family protein [Pseudomonadales bacterium]|jgi:octaprenyl-diphosphate synthase
MDPKRIFKVVDEDFSAVNQLILDQLHSDVDLVETISQYLVDSGGKRIRPLLVLLAANCCSYEGKHHILLAAIIEFLHTATLLHDDVVDMSEMRRGRSTANAVWGNAPSVLVGDFLYSRAFQMLVQLGNLPIMSIMANCTNQIAEGEVCQLTNARNPDLTEQAYRDVIQAKTAILFEAAAETAGILSGVSEEQQLALKKYGAHLGMTFQLVDDLLDYNGAAEEMGKNVGDDLAEGKMTLPLIQTLLNSTPENARLIREAVKENKPEHAEQIIALVKSSDALSYTLHQAELEANLAIQQLDQLPDNTYRDALRDLAKQALNRSK